MLSKRSIPTLWLGLLLVVLLALPASASIFSVKLYTFRGTLTEVTNTSVNVVDYDNQKVVQAFVAYDPQKGTNLRLVENFKPGDIVRIKVARDKNGRWVLAKIKKLSK